MSIQVPTMRERASARWMAAKPLVMGLAIGLVAGPMVSGFAGFQIRTSTAAAATRAESVALQAGFCAERARAAAPTAGANDWQARNDLARRFATAPGGTADADVVYACSSRLAG